MNNKDCIKVASEILNYLTAVRQVGHTTTVLDGATKNPCILVVHNKQMADNLTRKLRLTKELNYNTKIITLADIERGCLKGLKLPLVIDNAALYVLFDKLINHNSELNIREIILQHQFDKELSLGFNFLKYEKPPVGLMPRKIWLETRFKEILDAIKRYSDVNKQVPMEWLNELTEINKQISSIT